MHHSVFSATTYTTRRNQLAQTIGSGQIIFPGNQQSSVNYKDNWYPFRQDSCFLYYAGIDLPDLIILINVDKGETILFGDNLTMDDIVWTGPQPSLEELAAKAGIQKVLPRTALTQHLKEGVKYLPPYRAEQLIELATWTGQSIEEVKQNTSIDLIKAIIAQREIKTPAEIKELHRAVSWTSGLHEAVIRAAKPGMKEHQLVGIAREYLWRNSGSPSFSSILTINGQILHNHDYSHEIKEGDLILHDAGAEVPSRYAGDMTRTFPASDKFTNKQADIYNIVLDALNAAVDALKPGTLYRDVHLIAALKIAEGLTQLGLMKGDPAEAVQQGAHALFFPHGLGHMMGLDVHDMENLGEDYVGYTSDLKRSTQFGTRSLRLGKALQEGFVITVEPGIYMIPQLMEKFKSEGRFLDFINYSKLEAYHDFGGIRIEDDYVINATNGELLGTPLAKTVEAIEALRAS